MKLDALSLTATITRFVPKKKLVTFEYPWCDVNEVEEQGLGITGITVEGTLNGYAARDALWAACEAAGVKKLYFPSVVGAGDDRYMKVYTHAPQFQPAGGSATVYRYTLECLAADPAVYDAATDTAVW